MITDGTTVAVCFEDNSAKLRIAMPADPEGFDHPVRIDLVVPGA
ncbi:MAG: hypothetical protein OXF88_15765 [Rhodobacteraceae bacterium]|nr:hypothetical protein [Paracoccaceae bacterium]MCY4137667.1 hypothetical protein [Paracoccaceae bacterium]